MGKRSNFKRNPRDFYETPEKAVLPLIPHLPWQFRYISPCYGSGNIERHLNKLHDQAYCTARSELYPEEYNTSEFGFVEKEDAREYSTDQFFDFYIENPPWDRRILHEIIDNLAGQKPTWLLFDADWMHTKQAIPYLGYCRKIVSVGRVSWMGNGVSGVDNCCWYLFDKTRSASVLQFVERVA